MGIMNYFSSTLKVPGCLGSKSGEKPFLCGVKIHGHSKLPPSHSNSVKSILEFQVQRYKISNGKAYK